MPTRNLARKIGFAAVLTVALASGGCSWHSLSNTEKGAIIGGTTGAVIGGVASSNVGGAVAGGIVGGVAGALIGSMTE